MLREKVILKWLNKLKKLKKDIKLMLYNLIENNVKKFLINNFRVYSKTVNKIHLMTTTEEDKLK